MTSLPPPQNEDNSRYFRDAAELRFNVQMSKDDYEFAKEGNRIVYLVDANVVNLFLNPTKQARHVTPFVSDSRSDHLAGTALITAEFLFSRMLAGQQNTPVFITPAHFHEVVDFVNDQDSEPEMPEPDESVGSRKRLALQDLVDRLRVGAVTREAVIDHLRRDVPVLLNHLLHGRLGIANQLLRLYETDLLRPLDLHPAATAGILDPPQSEINDWVNLINEERRLTERRRLLQKQAAAEAANAPQRPAASRKGKEDTDLHRLRDNMTRDAVSIVQLLLLNKAAADTDLVPRTRYVLITADRSLFRAYAFWFWTQNAENPEPAHFALRLPTQYVPVLKIEEMPNCVENSDIIKRTSEALDGLLKNIHTVDRNKYPYTLPYHIGLDFRDHVRKQMGDGATRRETFRQFFNLDLYRIHGDPEVFRGIKNDWAAAYRNAEVLNAELMANRARAEFEPLATLLKENASLRDALVAQQRKLLQSVEARHTQFSIFNNYFRMLPQAAHRAGRGPMAIRVDFTALTGAVSFNAFVSILDREPKEEGIARITRVAETLRANFNHEAMLFAACAAYRCEDWPAARHYAERAIALLSSLDGMTRPGCAADRHEAEHLIACTLRFALSLDSDLAQIHQFTQEAKRLLEAGLRYFERMDDALGCYRAQSELGALNLTAAYAIRMRARNPSETAADAADHIRHTVRQIEDAATSRAGIPTDAADDILKVVDTQFYANIISLEAYLRHVGPEDGIRGLPVGMVERALAEMEPRVTSGGYPTVLAVEHAVVRWSLESDQRTRRMLHDRFCALCEESLKAGTVLTELDRDEVEWLHARCQGLSTSH
ncbi:hypothetical protein J2848_004284 [Azospirillum lipoferum]|uniref:PIN like domain-containing protein n=1 Tax=Azospirillum lipoferum TaxID=193 RepID=A0A5A9GI50_AZOLI|nr:MULTISPECIES: hypothetical protein [Azospirillum]KAA0594100.1 hypothetical protein FZ942_22000 [Azospirillum lipoferum]MCP1612593.1 hypothetical protein [Azospirillum lipoferum]MDW5531624.1 hypothetical protein [Azospirillum sp. NL1]